MGNSILDHRWIDSSNGIDGIDGIDTATADPNQPNGILTMDELILALCIMAAMTPDESDHHSQRVSTLGPIHPMYQT